MILAPKYKFKPSGTPKIIVPSLHNNLMGQWLFNEGSGNTVFDLSKKGNNGTLTGTAPSWTTGKFGSAVNFPGTDEYISITNEHNFDFERTDPFSVSLWLMMDANESAAIFSKSEVAGNERGWLLWQVQGASTPKFQLQMQSTGGNYILVTTSNEYPINTWFHTILTYDGSSAGAGVTIYINGVPVSVSIDADALSATILNNIAFQFSGLEGGNTPFDGKIDNASVYNRELTAFEAALLYQNSFRMFGHVINPRLVHLVTVPTAGVTHQVEGSISTETTVSGNLSHTQNLLAGNINEPEATVSGNLSQTSNIAGSIDKPKTSVSGNLSQTSNVAGSISTETTVSGALTVTKVGVALEGSISTETTVSGSILINGVTVEPTGSISVQTELSGGITISQWRKFGLVGVNTSFYVNRGDHATNDFVLTDFTDDATYHNLDLSSIVPNNAKMVHLRLYGKNSGVGESFRICPYGYSNIVAPYTLKISVANQSIANTCNIFLNGLPTIQYNLSNGGWANVELDVLGWWL